MPRGLQLTDDRILHYMLLGYYGPEAKANAEAEVAEKRKSKPRSACAVDLAMQLINGTAP